jgi:hypothetical protein
MKTRLSALSLASAAALALLPGRADGAIVDWQAAGPIENGRVLPGAAPGGSAALRVTSAAKTGTTIPVAVIRDPEIHGRSYSVVGRVRYRGVERFGYLELWSVIPGRGRYFTRTLAPRGPLGVMTGDSGWRRFELPFSLGDAPPPSRLELNVVLPGRGTVWLGPLDLVTTETGATVSSDAWWSTRRAGILGSVAGMLLGVMGALIGVLASRGRARRVVLGLAWAVVAAGVASAILAVAAALDSQPREVWFPLVLFAFVALGVFLLVMPSLRQRFAALELRRIQSEDLGRGARSAPR